MKKTGVLLINLGTPDHCHPKSVYAYLKQFLNDPRVIDLPKLLRYILVNYIIIPLRYKKSFQAYEKIWTEQGSPLLVNSRNLLASLAQELGDDFQLALGMRYGSPSIETAWRELKNCQKIIAIPLFPQYSSAATGSAMQALLQVLASQWNIPEIILKNDFFKHPDYITAYASVIKERLQSKQVDSVLFSYHGLPERHLDKSACQATCSRLQACPEVHQDNAFCYRAQCYETSHLLAKKLELQPHQYQVTFQSRLGRTPWIKPYTDLVLPELRKNNIANVAIVCPSFVADCLETLEEVNIRAREQWEALGGKEFTFIPCLNDQPLWVGALANMIRSSL